LEESILLLSVTIFKRAPYFPVQNAQTSIMGIREEQKIANKTLDNVLLIVIQRNIIERKGGMAYGIQNR
jgi:hypothetical protein